MIGLGVSEADERVYRSLLRRPGVAADPAAVERLATLGLLTVDEDGRVTAGDPQTAVDSLIRRQLDEMNTRLSRITSARSAVVSLLAERSAGEKVELVDRLEGRESTQRRIWEITQDAGEVLTVHRRPGRTDEEMVSRTLGLLERGIAYRTIVHRHVLDDPANRAYMERIHLAGDRHRVTDEDIQTLVIADRATAFVAIEPGRPEVGALMITQPGIVAHLVELFENTWSRATELLPTPDGPTEAELEVLALLNRYGKDETAARSMGVSVRTFRGRVAQLMSRLGAANRFQAGVRANERGWT